VIKQVSTHTHGYIASRACADPIFGYISDSGLCSYLSINVKPEKKFLFVLSFGAHVRGKKTYTRHYFQTVQNNVVLKVQRLDHRPVRPTMPLPPTCARFVSAPLFFFFFVIHTHTHTHTCTCRREKESDVIIFVSSINQTLCAKAHDVVICAKAHDVVICAKAHDVVICTKAHDVVICAKAHDVVICTKAHDVVIRTKAI
jgi:hypothetical protein